MDQQYAYTRVRLDVLKALKGAIGKTYSPTFEELEVPPQPEFGDAAFPCFTLAQGLGRNPAEIATELAAKIGPKGMISKIVSRGPYVNFYFDMTTYGPEVMKEIVVLGKKYGHSNVGEGRRVMVEYANFNTHKEVHIGHLRNMVVGHLAINVLRATGHQVIATSYINDLGNNVAKCLWAMKKFHEHEVPEKGDEINFLGRVYTEATSASEENEEARLEISEIQKQLETKKGEWHKLWKQTRQWSIDAIYRIFHDMNIPIDVQYYESDLLDGTARIVQDLLDRGIAEVSEGATIVNLEDDDLGINLLRKSDGTYLYNGKDLALAERKSLDHDIDRSLIVVDQRQSLAMQQLFATLKIMGMDIPYEHLSYGFVTLPDGAMSSRKGNIVRFEELRDTLMEAAAQETRERHNDWTEKQVKETARGVSNSAMVYAMAKQDSSKDIVFNIEEAISFDGMSGPYLLYSVSRIESLINSARIKPRVDGAVIDSPEARELINMLARYPEVVLDSASEMQLADIPQYAFELAQCFSSYYAEHRVLDDANAEVTSARLALVGAVLVTLKNALGIMNIDPVKQM